MRLRHDEAPAIGTDPLDIAGDVAQLVLAILQRPVLVGEDKGSKEDVADGVAGKDQADIALSAVELRQALQLTLGPDSTGEWA